MKKLLIIITILISFCNLSTFAATNCSSPTTIVNVGGTPYKCGYTNDPAKDTNNNNSLCYLASNNLLGALLILLGGGVTGCQTLPAAPINGGLIFLIIAGVILGTYMIYKKQKLELIEGHVK